MAGPGDEGVVSVSADRVHVNKGMERQKFGNRHLTESADVYDHNAW